MVVIIYSIDDKGAEILGNDEILRNMGERIMTRRKQLRMTQEELADRMDVSTQMISYAEQGRKAIRPENLIKLCAALDISADDILTGAAPAQESSRIAAKLARLTEEQLQQVETVIDCCIALAGSD